MVVQVLFKMKFIKIIYCIKIQAELFETIYQKKKNSSLT